MRTDISRRQAELVKARRPFVHATVVRAAAPTSVRTGDHAIVLDDGTLEGFIGGQCTIASVKLAAMDALRDQASLLLRVLPDDAPEFPASEGARVVVNPCLSGGAAEIYLEPVLPAPVVHVTGVSPVARAVADLARAIGYTVTTDEEGATADGATAVVIARHGGPEPDDLRSAIDVGVRYVGMVASSARGQAVLHETGLDEEERAQVHTPAGLRIGARTPEEIAVSILAEFVSVLRAEPAHTPDDDGAEPTEGHRVPLPLAEAAPEAAPEVAIDPICGMSVVIAPDAIHLEVDGADYYFCREGCRETFRQQQGAGAP